MEWKERKLAIEQLPDDTMFYIQNGWVGNSVSWWGLNNCGYTIDIDRAQIYTKNYILSTDWREEDRIWEASEVENNIKRHVDSQYLNTTKRF